MSFAQIPRPDAWTLKMANLIVVGAQWGDEGKGKIVDLLTGYFDVVARYQGGTTPVIQSLSMAENISST